MNIRCSHYNHPSATNYKHFVSNYLNNELEEKAMLGPFFDLPLKNLHTSPIMSRPKDKDKRRIIIDLSWDDKQSLNANVLTAYDDIPYILRYPSLDVIRRRILALGTSALIYKIDLSWAFRNLPVDPCDVHMLGLSWNNNYYIDLAILFGYIHGSTCCQRLTDAIRYICCRHNVWLFNYCDDLIGVELPEFAQEAFLFTKNLIENIGLSINPDKLVAPSAVVVCIGIQISVTRMTFSIPPEKMHDIRRLCNDWIMKERCNKKQLQSRLGKLLYISKCVRYARIFLGRMLHILRENNKARSITLNQDFKRDIKWFESFLDKFNGVVFFNDAVVHHIYVDASFAGVGAYFNGRVYAYIIPHCFNVCSIVHLEMLNVLIAIRCWREYVKDSVICIHCDNATVVAALKNYRIKDDFLLLITRNIWLELATANITLKIEHIPGASNVYADILSRWSVKHKFSYNHVKFLEDKCDWFYINDNTFSLNQDI